MITPTTRRRALVLALPAAYVAIAAMSEGAATRGTWAGIAAAIVVALLGARLAADEDAPARGFLVSAAGLSVVLATAAYPGRPGWAASARALGALACAIVAARAIAAIEGDVGLASKATEADEPRGISARTIARIGIGTVVLAWGTSAFVDSYGWAADAASYVEAAPVTAAVCGSVALFVLGAVAVLVAGARRFELASPPRAVACAAAAGVGLLSAIALAIAGVLRADAAVAVTSAVASCAIVRVARARNVVLLAKRGRRALALTLYGAPIAVLAALAVEGHLPGSSGVALVLCLAAVVVGALASKLEEPFLPVKGVWLDAFAEAERAAREREPRAAIAHALVKLRQAASFGAGPTSVPSPELWMLHPTRVITVNAAGYLQEKEAELPADIFDIAAGEPHATVRTAVLRALEVRRADLRALLGWLDRKGALFATVIAETGEPDGLLVAPAGGRHEPMTLEEAMAAKRLADAFVAVCQTTSARERHLARERDLTRRIDHLDDALGAIRHVIEVDGARHALASTRLARPATVGIYSAAARMAYDALERRIVQDAPAVVLVRPGMDPVPYVARAHLVGPRKDKPLVLVDGTSTREHDLDRWKDDRTSPLALADGGLLVLVDGAALPRDVQVLVARALGERRPPWERATPLDLAVAMITTTKLEVLAEENRLAPELYARFEDAAVIELAGLHERPEDLRSIVADRLAREGLRTRGRPIGIEAAAFARLVEHPFEGEDVELWMIVARLVARLEGDVVRAADVDALGFVGRPAIEEEAVRTLSLVGGTAARTVFVAAPPQAPEPVIDREPTRPPFEMPSLARTEAELDRESAPGLALVVSPESSPEPVSTEPAPTSMREVWAPKKAEIERDRDVEPLVEREEPQVEAKPEPTPEPKREPEPEPVPDEREIDAMIERLGEEDDLAIFDSLRLPEHDIPVDVDEMEEAPTSKRRSGLGTKRKGRGKRKR